MRVCVLLSTYEHSNSPLRDYDPLRNLTKWLPDHDVEHVLIHKGREAEQLQALEADVFVNLCDGSPEEDLSGVEVIQWLEQNNRAFTGCGSAFYDVPRLTMKRDCERAGVATPRYVFAYDEAGVERAVREVPLPAFAKPHHGYCSIGIDEGSRVTTADALRARVRKLINDHGGALVEEYIDGREVSVLVSTNPLAPDDPYVYLPVEWLAGVGVPFKTLAVKWYGSKNAWIAVDDTALVDRLKGVSRAAWLASNGDGYARLDIRIDARGEPYVLDVNANCGLFYIDEDGGTADLIVMLDGVGKAGFLARMIAHALHRAGHTVANIR